MLSQAMMDRVARDTMRMRGALVETFTYHARATSASTPMVHEDLTGNWCHFSERLIAMHAVTDAPRVQREDIQLQIPVTQVSWTPTTYDVVIRSDHSHWRVLDIMGGPGHPFWLLQIRRVRQ
jgi:hypothetical protein